MPYEFYRLLHVGGVIVVLMAVSGLAVGRLLSGGGEFKWRRELGILHGIGLLVVFVAGFGLLARIGVSWPWQHWVFIKMIIWLWIGAVPALARQLPDKARILWWSALAAALVAAFLAGYKPF